jgi:hypothetical protein
MRKIAGNRDVAVARPPGARRWKRVVFTSGQQGAAAEWNSEDVIGEFRDIGGRPVTKHSVP